MAIELAGITLKRIHSIETLEQTHLVHHIVPGMQGSALQQLGRASVRLRLGGILYGATASKDLETLRTAYLKRQAVDFLADIVGQAYFSQVMLEQFEVSQSAQEPDQFNFALVLTEYVQPPPRQTAVPASKVNASIKANARNFMTVATLPDALSMGALPEITNPIAPLKRSIEPIQAATQPLSGKTQDLKQLFNL